MLVVASARVSLFPALAVVRRPSVLVFCDGLFLRAGVGIFWRSSRDAAVACGRGMTTQPNHQNLLTLTHMVLARHKLDPYPPKLMKGVLMMMMLILWPPCPPGEFGWQPCWMEMVSIFTTASYDTSDYFPLCCFLLSGGEKIDANHFPFLPKARRLDLEMWVLGPLYLRRALVLLLVCASRWQMCC